MLSVIVLTKNAEKTIKECLDSLSFAGEIVIVDDLSNDNTVRIAKTLGAKVYSRKLAGDFSAQRNFGLEKARGEWSLFVDSDEKIDRDLKAEIEKELNHNRKMNGYYFKRNDQFLGRWLRFGETGKVRLLRLGRKNKGTWQGKVHETWEIKGPTKVFENPIYHQREITISEFMDRIQNYAQLRAKELYQKRVKESPLRIFFNPLFKFLDNYFFKLGILDGEAGLAMAWLMSWHSLLVRLNLALYWRNHGQKEFKVED
ncbi:hypothetical protein A2160_02030 [Candidatus Beckwithbacteria bacterium RBG_13_42_9]|uniref:Glycosyltransferase 2-like domain-containing protein n=1 Tax=Candidatus Beckwithbacteria bacterium RBG_13_42_9 TaxID=1797457 RepID=A0A1F5E7P2_9BACT|nr:MAG: hypothetical protein A2160_02030 [Candidatus Beckwithbacteria bacterium RBG_13_42_9]